MLKFYGFLFITSCSNLCHYRHYHLPLCYFVACIQMMEGFIAGGTLREEEIGPGEGTTVWERGKYVFFKEGNVVLDSGK